MFRNRRSQKPSDDLYKSFKAKFPQLIPPNIALSSAGPSSSAPENPQHGSTALAGAVDLAIDPRPLDGSCTDHIKDDPTPRGHNDPWAFGASGLTPSIMDPNSNSFNLLANQLPDYYTPNSGGANLYHHQAGDLHTPSYGLGLGTPLSMPTSEGPVVAEEHSSSFNPFRAPATHHLEQEPFEGVDPFSMHHHHTSYPPHHFSHHPSYDGPDDNIHESPIDMSLPMDLSMSQSGPAHISALTAGHFRTPALLSTMQQQPPPPPPHHMTENFRYHVTLNAPTAMVKHVDEIPITYLNKGQVYTLNVLDTRAHTSSSVPVRYRTFLRVSFEDEQQRAKPAGCWQLWKEGRGTNEAHQRGGRLQAVEYVEPGHLLGPEELVRPKVDLQSASFDGFCVTWTRPPTGPAECPIAVRFNFLSTDFSHSKGVKGIPVRLCAKTEVLADMTQDVSTSLDAEVSYCKVKLFRDHGAERKLSNDVAHVKKTIEKLNQQIVQVESGMRDLGKRKRGIFARSSDERPAKLSKHRRTWSLSSLASSSGRHSAEDEMHLKLMSLQDMFSSTRHTSVLHLRGSAEDDPDLHPVKLSGEVEPLVRHDSGNTAWDGQSASPSTSPAPSNKSSISRRNSTLPQQQQQAAAASTPRSGEAAFSQPPAITSAADIGNIKTEPDVNDGTPVKMPTVDAENTDWIDVVGVDPSYLAPTEPAVRPIACVYVKTSQDSLYRAVYLTQRTVKDFVTAVARKCDVEPTHVTRTVRITRNGLSVLFDKDCVRELPEGQDMKVEFSEVHDDDMMKSDGDWHNASDDLHVDSDLSALKTYGSMGYELRIYF